MMRFKDTLQPLMTASTGTGTGTGAAPAPATAATAVLPSAAVALPHAAPSPCNLLGRQVRIDGLQGRPELNGRCGVAGRFDAAKGRYEVAVEGEVEAVLLKPANLQEALEPYSNLWVLPSPNSRP